MKTITFSTGRIYDGEQVITASSVDGRVIKFADDSRYLSYTFKNSDTPTNWDKETVMNWYDGNRANKPEIY